jgi:hypothetical protein
MKNNLTLMYANSTQKLRRAAASVLWVCLACGFLVMVLASFGPMNVYAQQPTVAIPTVTGSPSGPVAVVNSDQDQINVRSGPSVDYPIVGVLVAGQKVPALGRSPGGDWVMVSYPGIPGGTAWVYSYLITLQGSLPIVEPPPTPTPQVTPTIDPTLAAQFVIEIQPTRLPTFTPPAASIVLPTFTAPENTSIPAVIPMGFVIIGMAALGLLGLVISLLRGG